MTTGSVVRTGSGEGTGELRDGRSTRWDPHRKRRRMQIITAAVDAIELHGPDVLTGQIALQAGVPRTHVYRHFEGKPALDLAVTTHVATSIRQQIRGGLARHGSARQVIGAAIDEHLGWIEAHPNLYRFLAQHAYVVKTGEPGGTSAADAKAVFAAELTELVQAYLRALGADDHPAERMIVGVVGLVDATAAWWLDQHDTSRADLCTDLTETVWLIINRTLRDLGIDLDPDAPLPAI